MGSWEHLGAHIPTWAQQYQNRAKKGAQFGGIWGAIGSFFGDFLRFEKWLIFYAVLGFLLAALKRLQGHEVL